MDLVGGKNIRDRNWFITINPNAECYIKFREILNNQNSVLRYAYIYHEADEDNNNDNHIHLCIEFKNARSFDSMQNVFEGAHIEHMKFKSMSYRYLIHLGFDDKKQYSTDCVITNNKDYFLNIIKCDDFERLDTAELLSDIEKGADSITYFVKKYGIHQLVKYNNLIKTLLLEQRYLTEIELKNEEIRSLNNMLLKRDLEIQKLKKRLDDFMGNLPF